MYFREQQSFAQRDALLREDQCPSIVPALVIRHAQVKTGLPLILLVLDRFCDPQGSPVALDGFVHPPEFTQYQPFSAFLRWQKYLCVALVRAL